MKRYTTLHPLYMSFYSKSLYQDVGRNWGKVSFLYLFLLLSVSLIPVAFKLQSQIAGYLFREAPKIIQQVPRITIAKGTVSVNEKMPYIIKEPETNAPLIIIDTTGQVASLKDSDAMVLLTKTQVKIRKPPTGTRVLELSGIDDLVIDQGRLYDWIDSFVENVALILYPVVLLLSFFFKVLQALVFAVVGMGFARNLKASLRYRALLSLAIVAMTPAILIDTLYTYIGIPIPMWWLVTFSITIGYLFFALKAVAQDASTSAGNP